MTAGDGSITVFHTARLPNWISDQTTEIPREYFLGLRMALNYETKSCQEFMEDHWVFFEVEEIMHTLNKSFMLSRQTTMDAEVVYLKLKTKNKTTKNVTENVRAPNNNSKPS